MAETPFDPATEIRRARTERDLNYPSVGSLISHVAERDGLDRDLVGDVFEEAWRQGEVTTRMVDGMQFFGLPEDAAPVPHPAATDPSDGGGGRG